MVNNAVEVTGLRVVRGGREVLRELRFVVPSGQVIGLVGPSGSLTVHGRAFQEGQ